MPKPLQLYLDHTDPSHIIEATRSDGTLAIIYGLRLIAYANFLRMLMRGQGSSRYSICKCLVDTGSYLSVIPQEIWRRFLPGVVTPLPFRYGTPHHLRTLAIAGGTYPFKLGELSMRLEDKQGTIKNVTILAKLTLDNGRLQFPITLGLRGGFLDGRRLLGEPDTQAPFGQKWTLEDP